LRLTILLHGAAPSRRCSSSGVASRP